MRRAVVASCLLPACGPSVPPLASGGRIIVCSGHWPNAAVGRGSGACRTRHLAHELDLPRPLTDRRHQDDAMHLNASGHRPPGRRAAETVRPLLDRRQRVA